MNWSKDIVAALGWMLFVIASPLVCGAILELIARAR